MKFCPLAYTIWDYSHKIISRLLRKVREDVNLIGLCFLNLGMLDNSVAPLYTLRSPRSCLQIVGIQDIGIQE